MPYLGIFGLKFKKTIVMFEIRTVKFVKNERNFSIGSTFSKGPCPGAGPLYKVFPP